MRLFVLAFALGVIVLQQAAALPAVAFAPLGLAALLARALVPAPRQAVHVVLLALAGSCLGYGYAAWRAELRLADALPHAWEGLDIQVAGRIAGLPQRTVPATRVAFHVDEVRTPQAVVPERIALAWYAEGTAAARVAPPEMVPGERWVLTVRLKRPRGLANPHAFDFEPWALERDIRATGYVRTRAVPRRIEGPAEGWPYTLHRWRAQVRSAMERHLDDAPLRGVLVALAIGDQDAIGPADWETFWRTGVGHLMSISGLHITMLAALASALARFAWVRLGGLALRLPARKAAVVAGTLTALAYCLMAGYGVPAQRTFAMLGAVAASVLFDRHGSASRMLAAAAMAVLLVDPWAVLAAGFWLSFGAVAAIFFVMAARTGRPGKLRGAALEQLAVTVAMVPMLVALFGEVSLVSPLANALAIPVVSLMVVPLTVAGAFLGVGDLLDGAHALLAVLMVPLEAFAALDGAMLESHAPAPWAVAAALAGGAWLLAPRGVPLRAAGLVWMLPLFAAVPARPLPGEAWIDVLDVGNGLAVVVRTAAHALVYDAGPSWNPEADSGARIVVPFLRGEGLERIDGLVISHADDDHAGGAQSVTYSRQPPWLLSPLPAEHGLHGAFARSHRCEAGERWAWDGVTFAVLHPAAEAYDAPATGRPRKENDRSCVLRVQAGGAAALLTGDAEARSEAEMLARDPAALRSDVLLVPHHGSKSSSSAAFIDAVGPASAVLSVGHRNRFGHPHAGVVARYVARGIALHRTDRSGALRVLLPAESNVAPRVQPLVREVRYWSERRVR